MTASGQPRQGPTCCVTPGAGRDPQQTLGEMLTGGSYVRSLFVVTGDQLVVANAPGENLTRSDATWFDELRSSQMQSWVGPVVTTAADGSLALPLAVRVAGDNGVKSWAGALIRISDLDQIYQGLKASRSTVAIVTLQGTALVQLPLIATNPMNMDVSKSEAYRRFLGLARAADHTGGRYTPGDRRTAPVRDQSTQWLAAGGNCGPFNRGCAAGMAYTQCVFAGVPAVRNGYRVQPCHHAANSSSTGVSRRWNAVRRASSWLLRVPTTAFSNGNRTPAWSIAPRGYASC